MLVLALSGDAGRSDRTAGGSEMRRAGRPPAMRPTPGGYRRGMADSLTDTTTVPELVGLAAADAHDAALDARLLAIPKNAAHTGAGRSTVTNQRPRAGASATPGDTISIWVDAPAAGPSSDEGPDDDGSGGGGGGSRVPEGPKPTPTAGAA